MRMKLQIQDVDVKTTQRGVSYSRFKTEQGWMSCFDKDSCGIIAGQLGQSIECEVTEKQSKAADGTMKTFRNIVKCYKGSISQEKTNKIMPESVENPLEKLDCEQPPVIQKKTLSKDVTFNTSYAKDIFCELYKVHRQPNYDSTLTDEELMINAIALVKQARSAFE